MIGCRSVDNYKKIHKIQEGTYGIVYKAKEKKSGIIVALKKLKLPENNNEGMSITGLREITILQKLTHENIIRLRETVIDKNDNFYLVMDYCEFDLKYLMSRMDSAFLQAEIKTLLMQLLSATKGMHDNFIVHRDLKTSNLLYDPKHGIKVADFGLARKFSKTKIEMTQPVVTLWYRAPELLLGENCYTEKVDMWSIGCIFAELVNNNEPLFQGNGEIEQLHKIYQTLGLPSKETWKKLENLKYAHLIPKNNQKYENKLRSIFTYMTNSGFDLLQKFLTYNPEERISATDALNHPYFSQEPFPADMSSFPLIVDERNNKEENSIDDEELMDEYEKREFYSKKQKTNFKLKL